MLRAKSARLPRAKAHPGDSEGSRLLARGFGVLLGILIGLLILVRPAGRIAAPENIDPAHRLSDIEQLCPDEIQVLIVKALEALGEHQTLATGVESITDENFEEPAADRLRAARRGIDNMRRLLPSVKGWTSEALQNAVSGFELAPPNWPRIDRMIDGVHRIVRDPYLHGSAAIRDSRLSEILVDPAYAADLNSDDVAVFVLAHELVHVAARSGMLNGLIDRTADNARRGAHVEPTEDQREDLTCDFVAEMVLRRFVLSNPTSESHAVRISRVLGYLSPSERFAQAWELFCASYNGDPGDKSHLNQYQTISSLLALDPELACLMSDANRKDSAKGRATE